MGRVYLRYLDAPAVYRCRSCRAHLADAMHVISKSFQGRTGKAYLIHSVINVEAGEPEERSLMTGRHLVADVLCKSCNTVIGWKYIRAYEESQKYKEGKFVVEKAFMKKERNAGRPTAAGQ